MPDNTASAAASPSTSIASVLTAADCLNGRENYGLADDVMLIVLQDDTGRLIDWSGGVLALSRSATSMLELMLRRGRELACKTIVARYGVAPGRVLDDMESLFHDLARRRFLVRSGRAYPGRAMRRFMTWTIAPLVFLTSRLPSRWLATKAWLLSALAFAATRLFGWRDTVRMWEVSTRRPVRQGEWLDDINLVAIEGVVVRTMASHVLPVDCKERALCAWALARADGVPAAIVVGVDLFPFGFHSWCEVGTRILADRWEGRCDRYTRLLVYS